MFSADYDVEKKNLHEFVQKLQTLSPARWNELLAHQPVAQSSVLSISNSQQQMKFYVLGLHPKPCARVLRKLSLYEQYSHFLDFVEKSQYDPLDQKIYLMLNAKILPFRMALSFKIPRINLPGVYPYEFKEGIFPGLKGNIHVFSVDQKECLFYTTAVWLGPSTKIPNLVIEMFSETLSKISMEKLFRLTYY